MECAIDTIIVTSSAKLLRCSFTDQCAHISNPSCIYESFLSCFLFLPFPLSVYLRVNFGWDIFLVDAPPRRSSCAGYMSRSMLDLMQRVFTPSSLSDALPCFRASGVFSISSVLPNPPILFHPVTYDFELLFARDPFHPLLGHRVRTTSLRWNYFSGFFYNRSRSPVHWVHVPLLLNT